jgi:hypothetical protein
MELSLSPSAANAADKFRQSDAKVSRPIEEAEASGGEKASDEAEALALKAAARDGEEEQSRKSAVDSDTGQNLDLSV